MSVLVIDDSVDTRFKIRAMLKEAKHTEVIALKTSREILDFLAEPTKKVSKIDLIIFNIDQYEFELSKFIKDDKSMQEIPILAISEKNDVDRMRLAFAFGASDFISQPIIKEEFTARVRLHLKLKYERDFLRSREKTLVEVANQLEEANNILQKYSSIDGLTGAKNRQFFDETLNRELRRAFREQNTVSLLLIDIDYFKQFNDTYGHQAGDKCLKEIAEAINQRIRRPGDVLARYGGEEFAVILPNTSMQGAMNVAEAIRETVVNLKITHENSKISDHITISIGCSCFDATEKYDCDTLVAYADVALYKAKNSGRNQVRSFNNLDSSFIKKDDTQKSEELVRMRQNLNYAEEKLRSTNINANYDFPLVSDEEIAALMKNNSKDIKSQDYVSLNESYHESQNVLCQEEWESFFYKTEQLIAILTSEGDFHTINPSFCEFLDKAEKDLVGNNIFEFIATNDRQKFKEQFKQIDEDNSLPCAARIVKNGSEAWFHWEMILQEQGTILLVAYDK